MDETDKNSLEKTLEKTQYNINYDDIIFRPNKIGKLLYGKAPYKSKRNNITENKAMYWRIRAYDELLSEKVKSAKGNVIFLHDKMHDFEYCYKLTTELLRAYDSWEKWKDPEDPYLGFRTHDFQYDLYIYRFIRTVENIRQHLDGAYDFYDEFFGDDGHEVLSLLEQEQISPFKLRFINKLFQHNKYYKMLEDDKAFCESAVIDMVDMLETLTQLLDLACISSCIMKVRLNYTREPHQPIGDAIDRSFAQHISGAMEILTRLIGIYHTNRFFTLYFNTNATITIDKSITLTWGSSTVSVPLNKNIFSFKETYGIYEIYKQIMQKTNNDIKRLEACVQKDVDFASKAYSYNINDYK